MTARFGLLRYTSGVMMQGYLDINRKLIDKTLNAYLPNKTSYPAIIHEAMRYSVMNGGKRIRPILVLESSIICGGKYKDALPLACAIELIHSYSLIHDDLPSMDDSATRRGKPSCHIKYGEALAILAGDALLTLAFNLISRGKNKARVPETIFEISKAIGTFGMIGGQVADLKFKNDKKISPAAMKYINLHKTASLISAAAKTGAMIAGASDKKIRALERYGELIGLVFQIVDDIMDGDGYVKSFGEQAARYESRRLLEKAKAALVIFGKKADRLIAIADFVIDRKN